jgi:hypothetical protein
MLSTRSGGVVAAYGHVCCGALTISGTSDTAASYEDPMRSTVEEAGLRILFSLGSSLFGGTKAEDLTTKTDLHQRETGIGRGFSHRCSQFVNMLQLMVLPQTLGL